MNADAKLMIWNIYAMSQTATVTAYEQPNR